jgi:parallel beta-helix repeat protein
MTDDGSKALVPQAQGGLSPISRLAERTLAERAVREERALVTARTLVVGPGGYATISAAVASARDGDTILVRPGRYEESVVVERKSLTIRGDGESQAIVVGWNQGPAFTLVETRSTLAGLTIVGGRVTESSDGASLLVTGGAPQLDWLRVTRGTGIVFVGGAVGAIGHSQVSYNYRGGIRVRDGASPRIEGNEIWGNTMHGIQISGVGTDPLVRANRLHDCRTSGIGVRDGASPRIEGNEIWGTTGSGIDVSGARTDPLVQANRIHDGHDCGISVRDGASPRIEGNEIRGNAGVGISISGVGTDPLVKANRVHDGQQGGTFVWQGAGIFVSGGASPRIEENEVWGNASVGIAIRHAGTSPVIIGNVVRDGLADGIYVLAGASPTIAGNRITGNALQAIHVDADANPKIGQNVVGD